MIDKKMADASLQVDVAVVGAGLVGLSAALALTQAGYQVALVDSQAAIITQMRREDWDQRIYAISPINAKWLASLGVWQCLDASRVCEIQSMEIWGDATTQALLLAAEDVNADALGYIVEESTLKQALMQCLQISTVHQVFGTVCKSVQTNPQQTVLQLADGQTVTSQLLIAADGANSWIREQINIGTQQKDYHQTAIVANFNIEKPHHHIARQWFTKANLHSPADEKEVSGILAWLPLPDNKISIVWSVSTHTAHELLKLDNDAFTDAVKIAGQQVLGNLSMITPPAAFPLILKQANVLTQDGIILMGDAAHRIHPMAGQGVNLGFRDVMDWMEIIASKHPYQAINDMSLLKRYTRIRKTDTFKMTSLTNGLYHLFESQSGFVKKVRNWGLIATNQQTIKKVLVANAIAL